MTANELFTAIYDRGQKFLTPRQTALLCSLLHRDLPDAELPSQPYRFRWVHSGAIRTLNVLPAPRCNSCISQVPVEEYTKRRRAVPTVSGASEGGTSGPVRNPAHTLYQHSLFG